MLAQDFFGGDGAALLVAHGRPVGLGQNRPRQPVHAHRKAVDEAQINVGRDAARLDDAQKLLAVVSINLRFRMASNAGSRMADCQQACVSRCGRKAFAPWHFARCTPQAGVAVLQIDLRDLQVHRRLAYGLVFVSTSCRAISSSEVCRLVRLPVCVSTQ